MSHVKFASKIESVKIISAVRGHRPVPEKKKKSRAEIIEDLYRAETRCSEIEKEFRIRKLLYLSAITEEKPDQEVEYWKKEMNDVLVTVRKLQAEKEVYQAAYDKMIASLTRVAKKLYE